MQKAIINSKFSLNIQSKGGYNNVQTNLFRGAPMWDEKHTHQSPCTNTSFTEDELLRLHNGVSYNTVRDLYNLIISNESVDRINLTITQICITAGFNENETKDRLMLRLRSANINGGSAAFTKEELTDACSKLKAFFSEWGFPPSYRFVNTLCWVNDPVQYVKDYFTIFDSQFAEAISAKVNSVEFRKIMSTFQRVTPSKKINTRLEILYGDPGGGKTTDAIERSGKEYVIVCSTDKLPKDLLTPFGFSDGKPNFHDSILKKAMEEGHVVTLDEINMLPYETLKFIQGFTDGKEVFNFDGESVHIKEGFKIIGTMNLDTENGRFPISQALADRCESISYVELTPEKLVDALL